MTDSGTPIEKLIEKTIEEENPERKAAMVQGVANFMKMAYVIILRYLYFHCIEQSQEGLWRFQVEARVAYMCKQIFDLSHSPP